jgi:hypothetical protein
MIFRVESAAICAAGAGIAKKTGPSFGLLRSRRCPPISVELGSRHLRMLKKPASAASREAAAGMPGGAPGLGGLRVYGDTWVYGDTCLNFQLLHCDLAFASGSLGTDRGFYVRPQASDPICW